MMQSNSDFIPNFSQKLAILQEMTRGKVRFRWLPEHRKCFVDHIAAFKNDVILYYFDINKPKFIFIDAHEHLKQQNEMNDLRNLFILHSTPVIDKLDLHTIAEETKKDVVLIELAKTHMDSKRSLRTDA